MNRRRFVLAGIVAAAVMACGSGAHNGDHNPDGPGGSGTGGDGGMLPDGGPCTPGSMRCNGSNVEQCNGSGTEWVVQTMCTTYCADAACALPGLTVSTDMTLDGTIYVQGTVDIQAGATLSSPTGNLALFADSIIVETGGAITVAATGMTGSGAGAPGESFDFPASPGSYGTGPAPWGSPEDAAIFAGSPGGEAFGGSAEALGGGVLQLFAPTITMSGQLDAQGANGDTSPESCYGGGGASGGGILLFGNSITVTGSISTAGGMGGVAGESDPEECGVGTGEVGGEGRVALLYGSNGDFGSATITGVIASGLAPPLPLASTSHPNPTLIYNDNFVSLDMTWSAPFATQGYYVLLDQQPFDPPTAANGMFQAADKVSFSADSVSQGANYVHVVSVDQESNIGTIESTFEVQINTQPPSVTSSSHPDPTQFSSNQDPFFQWSYPQGGSNVSGAYYVFDHFGNTVPTTTDTMVPANQLQLLQQNVAPGVWVLHVVSADTQGRLTKAAGSWRVNIGTDPGSGAISGNVIDSTSQPVAGATVTVNNGLYTAITASDGSYSIPAVTAGMWQLSATMGPLSAMTTITVVAGMTASGDLTLQ